jgi:hypothetical protein
MEWMIQGKKSTRDKEVSLQLPKQCVLGLYPAI